MIYALVVVAHRHYSTLRSHSHSRYLAFVVPASALVEIELTFCAQAVNAESVLARLVYGGTSYEYASYASLVSPSTNNTLVIYKQDSNSLDVSVTTKWVLQFPSSAIGYGSELSDLQKQFGFQSQQLAAVAGSAGLQIGQQQEKARSAEVIRHRARLV